MDPTSTWPQNIRQLHWPRDGITYSFEHRGYIRPEKLDLWLKKAFGEGNAKYVVSSRLFV